MIRFRTVASAIAALTLTSAAYAQDAPASAPTQGPLIIEKIHNGIVVAPDYKVTELNGDTAQLAGAYAGRVIDDRLFIGGAGYWLANGDRGNELRYGGVMVGWTTAPRRIRFGARGIVGGGSGTLTMPLADRIGGRVADPRMSNANDPRAMVARFGVRVPPLAAAGTLPSIRVREEFFVFEPQVTAVTKVTDHVAIDVAAGYRVIGLADQLGDRLDGATGSVGLQLGW